MITISISIISLIITLFFFSLLAISYHKDPARLLNGFLFTIFLGWLFISVSTIAIGLNDRIITGGYVIIIAILIIALALVYYFQGIFWLWNAFIVWRRENHSLANMLTLVIGVLTIAFPFVNAFIASHRFGSIGIFIYSFFVLMILYILFCTFSFMSAAMLFTIRKPKPDKQFIIVLGAGLLHGDQVSPLLASRINKGIEFYHKVQQNTGKAPLLICSGGQGGDETVPEGQAMRQYAIDHGIPTAQVVAERKSKTTLQNMLFSKQIVEQHQLNLDNGIYVSNDYHIFRAGIYARQAGLKIQGLGAKTSKFFIPNATIREYIALLMNHKRFHIIMTVIIAIIAAGLSSLNFLLK